MCTDQVRVNSVRVNSVSMGITTEVSGDCRRSAGVIYTGSETKSERLLTGKKLFSLMNENQLLFRPGFLLSIDNGRNYKCWSGFLYAVFSASLPETNLCSTLDIRV